MPKRNYAKDKLFLEGRRIYLRGIRLSDADPLYCSWLNDPRVNAYLCCRFEEWDVPKLRSYIRSVKKDRNCCFWAIYRKDTGGRIGNIKLGAVNMNHRSGDIGIIIGDRSSWGKGFATEAIRLVRDFSFRKLRLHKLTAGSYRQNYGSIKSFKKAGFRIEGSRKEQFILKGRYVDKILLGCING